MKTYLTSAITKVEAAIKEVSAVNNLANEKAYSVKVNVALLFDACVSALDFKGRVLMNPTSQSIEHAKKSINTCRIPPNVLKHSYYNSPNCYMIEDTGSIYKYKANVSKDIASRLIVVAASTALVANCSKNESVMAGNAFLFIGILSPDGSVYQFGGRRNKNISLNNKSTKHKTKIFQKNMYNIQKKTKKKTIRYSKKNMLFKR